MKEHLSIMHPQLFAFIKQQMNNTTNNLLIIDIAGFKPTTKNIKLKLWPSEKSFNELNNTNIEPKSKLFMIANVCSITDEQK